MPYLFTCPHCQSKTRVEDRYSGKVGECFTCGQPIELPQFADPTALPSPSSAPTAKRRSASMLVAAGAVVVLLLCLVFAVVRFGGSGVSRLAEVRLQNASIKNLESIASALNAYSADHGMYPPAVLRDNTGQPLHSWRVLILPYLGEQVIYDLYDLSKPWNHVDNLDASTLTPNVYQHPADPNTGIGQTGYYLITGPRTLFPPTGPLSPMAVTDNASQTILVIAAKPPGTAGMGSWAQPIDLDFARMRGKVNGTIGIEAGGWLKGGVTMATVDGRGHFLPNETPVNTFNSLVTPTGNEPLADDTLD